MIGQPALATSAAGVFSVLFSAIKVTNDWLWLLCVCYLIELQIYTHKTTRVDCPTPFGQKSWENFYLPLLI